MYWTIRDAHGHWESENRVRRESTLPPKPKTDIVKTWDALYAKANEFKTLRAMAYLNKGNEHAVKAAEGAYQIFATNACQLGLVLALRSIAHKAQIAPGELSVFTNEIIAAVNAGLTSGGKPPFNRRLVFSREITPPFNYFEKLDTPLSIHFRYFWMELLSTEEARGMISNSSVLGILSDLRDLGREAYFNFLNTNFAKAIRAQDPTKDLAKIQAEALARAQKALKSALTAHFGVSQGDWDAWYTEFFSPTAAASRVKNEVDLEESQVIDISDQPWESGSSA
jgi:hypothetical protein